LSPIASNYASSNEPFCLEWVILAISSGTATTQELRVESDNGGVIASRPYLKQKSAALDGLFWRMFFSLLLSLTLPDP